MNPELIEHFFNKQCTAGEAEEIAAYLKANPSVLEKYLSLYEWNSLVENDMPEEFWNAVWHNIQKRNKAKILSLRVKQAAAAACIILLLSVGYFYLNPSKENVKPIADVHIKALPEQQRKSIANTTGKTMTIFLEDSSVIKLSPASIVQYDVPFAENKREIYLEGEATFHVAKNKMKPFTVYSGALATTALGTIFSVRKKTNNNIVTVKLFQGKVVIHSTSDDLKGWKQDVFLLPGQELKFNMQYATLAVGKMDSIDKPVAVIKLNKTGKETDSAKNQLTFSNTLLPEVMNKLSAYYKVNIKYDTLLINTMNFTGTVTKNDSLPVILKAIGQMNNLEILKNDTNDFIISKHE